MGVLIKICLYLGWYQACAELQSRFTCQRVERTCYWCWPPSTSICKRAFHMLDT